jgi:cysteine-rich repeat protein
MNSITRQFGLLCLGALAAALTACASNDVTLCEKANILCPAGTHCAGVEAVCIQDSNLCGDGHMDPGEVCDDGNTRDGDNCSQDCKSDLSCGNGKTDVGARVPEQCDDGKDKNGTIGSSCSATCQMVRCGNGVVEQGEQCDDSNITSGDGCSATCQREFCGNGHIDTEAGEVCDDGDKNGTPDDPCSANCRSNLSCNNAIVDRGEECDHGKFGDGNQTGNNNKNDCRADCQFNQCGDGFTDEQVGQRHEQCDEGHLTTNGLGQLIPVPTETKDCNIDCSLPNCGDGKVNRHFMPDGTHTEQCDSGTISGVNQNKDTAVCTAACQLNVCGDGHPLANVEPCDDGGVNTANCNANCTTPTCGDGIVNAAFKPDGTHIEQCDNGANKNKDDAACTSTCQVNVCGDHHVLAGIEACDSGGVDARDCDPDCTAPVCGDGHKNEQAGEACDEGNLNGKANPTGCNQFCQFKKCGDGILDPGEECDAGNGTKQNSAACDDNCTFAKCGDGFPNPVAGEACDDGPDNGKSTSAHHCNQFCQTFACGNGILEPGEQCDDGTVGGVNQNHAGARCNATCQFNVCGDGDLLSDVEQCETGHDTEGHPIDSPTCDRDCTLPVCGDGVPNTLAGEQCDEGRLLNGQPGHCNARCKSPLCGNGVIDVNVAPLPDEECDDGVNGVPRETARCNADCTFARCGDGFTNHTAGEMCDDGPGLNGIPCAYGNPFCTRCNATCTNQVSPGGPFCGDALTQTAAPMNEQCDPATGPSASSPMDLPSRRARADSATCDIDCTPVTCSDGYRNMVAGESCDDGNQSACGTCPSITATDCRGPTPVTPTTPTQAHTTVQASAAADDNGIFIQPGDSFKLDDGFGQAITFTFLEQSAGGNTEILFQHAPADSAGTIASAMAAAIHAQALQGFGIDASVPSPPDGDPTTVILTNKRKSSVGNKAITHTGLTQFVFGLNGTPDAMAGGLAGDCATTIGCVFADDCESGFCNSGKCQACTTTAGQCPASTTCNVATGKCH